MSRKDENEFYLRYYVGHKGRYGHEFMEFEFRQDGLLRYANNSFYRQDQMIRKEVYVSDNVLEELKRIIEQSEITSEDDNNWPSPNVIGRQELEIISNNRHICFVTAKIGSLLNIEQCSDTEGLKVFYFLVQDLKCYVFSLIGMHFKIKPI